MIRFCDCAEVRHNILGTMLFSIPETEFRLLSSLLACKGLSDLVYAHVVDVLIKLVKMAPPHPHISITKFSNAIERLSKVAMVELQCLLIWGSIGCALATKIGGEAK